MPFPNPATQFRRGGPGGPGRPRKHPERIRGTPWIELRQPDVSDVDFERLVDTWAAQVRAGQWGAVRAMIGVVEARDPASVRIRQALHNRLVSRPVPVPA